MDLMLGAKRTKPGSKASARGRANSNGKLARVPVGTLHYIDADSQTVATSMFVAICGEGELISLPDSIDEAFDNDLCPICADRRWASDFDDAQKHLLT